MTIKRLIDPHRIRRLPKQFSWIDQGLVSNHHISHCDPPALALYLFLVIVADHQGLSYYANTTIANRLRFDDRALIEARQQLIQQQLIAYQPPLYQVLALPDRAIAPQDSADANRVATVTRPGSNPQRESGPIQIKALLDQLQRRTDS